MNPKNYLEDLQHFILTDTASLQNQQTIMKERIFIDYSINNFSAYANTNY